MMEYLYIGIVFLGLINLIVSIMVFKSDYLGRVQKIAQILIVWLVPAFGAIGIWAFIRATHQPNDGRKREFGGGAWARGDEHGGME